MAKKDRNSLTSRRQRFVEEYLKDPNGTQAAIIAGYSPGNSGKSARTTAARLLANANVMAAIVEGQQKLGEATLIDAEKVLNEMALIGFSNMDDYVRREGGENQEDQIFLDFSNVTRAQMAAVQEITQESYVETIPGTEDDDGNRDTRVVRKTKFKLHPKLPALEQIAKHIGMTPANAGINIEASGPVFIYAPDTSDVLAE